MKKEDFLNKLRQNTHVQYDMPDMKIEGIQYENTLQQFIDMTKSVGGHVMEAEEGDDMLNEIVRMAYPEAKVLSPPPICRKSSWSACRLLLVMRQRLRR